MMMQWPGCLPNRDSQSQARDVSICSVSRVNFALLLLHHVSECSCTPAGFQNVSASMIQAALPWLTPRFWQRTNYNCLRIIRHGVCLMETGWWNKDDERISCASPPILLLMQHPPSEKSLTIRFVAGSVNQRQPKPDEKPFTASFFTLFEEWSPSFAATGLAVKQLWWTRRWCRSRLSEILKWQRCRVLSIRLADR